MAYESETKTHPIAMNVMRAVWFWLRQVSGDAAYENYLRHNGACARDEAVWRGSAASAPPLSRAEFYLDSLRRRYSTISRCC